MRSIARVRPLLNRFVLCVPLALTVTACADDAAPMDEDGSTGGGDGSGSTGATGADADDDTSTSGDTSGDTTDDATDDSTDASTDDGTDDSTDGDTSSSGEAESTTETAVCGDAVVAIGREDCEPDSDLLESCETLGFDGGTLQCSAECTHDTTNCFACGDAIVAGTEECEPGTELAAACTDLGFDGGALACTDACELDTTGCYECGDGQLDPGEACDGDAYPDGVFLDNCAGYGHTGGILGCTDECTIDDSACTDIPLATAGELIFTEVRKPPVDAGGAWFELHNLTTESRQLNTCVLSFGGAGLSFLDELVVGPGEYVAFGTTDPAAGIFADYELDVPLEGPFSQSVQLSCGATVDAVALDFADGVDFYELIDGEQVEIAPNASMQLDPEQFDATANNLGANWCASTSPIPAGVGFGTPGAPNDPC